jgi:regulator of replication initiation timing
MKQRNQELVEANRKLTLELMQTRKRLADAELIIDAYNEEISEE